MSTSNDTLPVSRGTLTVLLGLFAALWLGAAGYTAYRTAAGWGKPAVLAADAKPGDEPKEAAVPPDPNVSLFLVTAILAAAGTLAAAAGLVYHLTAYPPLTGPQMRKLILQVGVAGGGILVLIGLWYLLALFDLLVAWLERGEVKTAWKVLVPVLIVIVGAGLAFASTIPARAVERTDGDLRRFVYGSNAGIAAAMLFFGLVIVNVLAAVKLPNKLDTTTAGFYTLQPKTQQFLEQLDAPVGLYVLTPDSVDPVAQEIRRLVLVVRDANPGKISVKYPNTASAAEREKLKAKFPSADAESAGVIVAAGANEDRYSLVRPEDFLKQEAGEFGGRSRKVAFQGEGALMKELVFLTEGKVKPAVYFTQGHGELALAAAGDTRPAPGRSMEKLKAFLEKLNYDCRPLDLAAGKDASVPDDAAMVVVADPTAPFEPPAAEVLLKYLKEKKGKLFVASSPKPSLAGGAAATGLEGLLAAYNLGFANTFLYSRNTDPLTPRDVVAAGLADAADAKYGPADTFSQGTIFPDCRVVTTARDGGNPAVQTLPLFGSIVYPTWVETAQVADPVAVLNVAIQARDQAVLQKKQFTNQPRLVAAVAREGTTAKVVAVGSGQLLSDEFGRRQLGTDAGPLVAGTLDYLRERKEVPDVIARPFSLYQLPPEFSGMRMFGLPLAVAVLGLAALGVGVWAARRK